MEPQQQHPNGGLVCGRQSSTRWTPTTEQIRILKELYYNNGVRSPSADQIQRISARLRQYGKIEGKNVFYWFQNHKARERQKKRFTSTTTTTTDHHPLVVPCMQATRPNNNNNTALGNGGGGDTTTCSWKPDHPASSHLHNNYPNITHGYASSTGVLTVGVGQDYSISASGTGTINDHYPAAAYSSSSYVFFDKENNKFIDEINIEEEQEDYEYGNDHEAAGGGGGVHVAPHIETLPLFPMHGEDINAFCSNLKPELNSYYSSSSWYRSDDHAYTASRASLELSLNSYTGRSQDFI